MICAGHGASAGAQSSWLLQRPQGRGSTPESACLALQARGVQSPMDTVGLGQEKYLERKRDWLKSLLSVVGNTQTFQKELTLQQ